MVSTFKLNNFIWNMCRHIFELLDLDEATEIDLSWNCKFMAQVCDPLAQNQSAKFLCELFLSICFFIFHDDIFIKIHPSILIQSMNMSSIGGDIRIFS